MAAWRRAIELSLTDADTAKLTSIAQSRSETAGRVERARILLAYREDPSFFAVGQALGLHHQTVQRCVERAVAEGPMAALDDRPRGGREPSITMEAKAWLVDLACRKAKEFGYPHELWTTRLLASHARAHGLAEGHACLAHLAQGTVCKILDEEAVKPHKVRYYLECRGSRIRGENGRSPVRLSSGENPQEDGGARKNETERAGGDRFLRREAGYPGHCHDGPRFAARARRACDLRARA